MSGEAVFLHNDSNDLPIETNPEVPLLGKPPDLILLLIQQQLQLASPPLVYHRRLVLGVSGPQNFLWTRSN